MSGTAAASALILPVIFVLTFGAPALGPTSAFEPASGHGVTRGVVVGAGPVPRATPTAESHLATGALRWYNVTGSHNPVGRNRLAMAPDPTLGGLVMFGGYNPPNSPQFFSDTWLLAGGLWTQLHPATSPSARATMQMAWDSSDSVDVMFGGHPPFGSPTDLNDTWSFAGTGNGAWTQHPTPANLSLREGYAMCDDPADHGVLLFGGDSGASGAPGMNDTWIYRAGSWTELHPTHVATNRSDTSCAWDAAAGEDVMFGGLTGEAGSSLGDTWAFKADNWTLVTTTGPSVRFPNSISESPTGTLVTFSGGCPAGACGNDTWQFANGAWSPIGERIPPTDRSWAGLAYDNSTNASYIFGGTLSSPYAGWTNETYELAAPTLAAGTLINTFDVGVPAVASVQTGPTVAGGQLTVDWGDGSNPSIVTTGGSFYAVSHHYGAAGTYNATFTWTDALGRILATYLVFQVDGAPTVSVAASPNSGNTTPLAVAITASVTGGTGPYSFSWLAGDGSATQMSTSSSGTLSATHSYATNGTFEVHLTVTDGDAKSASATTNVTVTNSSPSHHSPPPNHNGNPNTTSGPAATPWLVWGILAAVVAVAVLAGVVLARGGRRRP